MKKKVVITGVGILSSIGIGRQAFREALFQGRIGFKPITLFDTSKYSVKTGGEITDFDPLAFLEKKGLRELDRSTRLVCSAAKLAIDDSKIIITESNTHSIGVSIGTTFGSLKSIAEFDRTSLIEGPRYVNPSFFPNTVINSPASRISIRFKIKGFNTTISTGCCAGIDAISYASDFISMARADIVFAGAVEELCEDTFFILQTMGCVSGTNGGKAQCCPFDARRNGIIFSEGSAVLTLEEENHAIQRNANILGYISGYANAFDYTSDGYFKCNGKGLENAIRLALKDAKLTTEDIDCIFSSANSTKELDVLETGVIKNVFGKKAYDIPITAVKSMLGETYSAGGALACASAVEALIHKTIPQTVNFEEKDPECDLDYVTEGVRKKDLTNILILSTDFYGNNSVLIISRYG